MASGPDVIAEPETSDDSQARSESSALQKQHLEDDRQWNEHGRQEKLRTVFAWGVIITLSLVFILIGAAMFIVVFHYLAPVHLHWVDKGDLKTVSTVLFSGTLFAFLGLYVRDRI